jgi:predicted aspartyl protease
VKTKGAKDVGCFSVDFEVANHVDVILAQQGMLEPDKVRKTIISGMVDSGATKLVLPEVVVKQLGLPIQGQLKVRYANNHTAKRNYVNYAQVQLQGREGIFSAVVKPKRKTALIGAIVLEDLDFLVDCLSQKLVPRDPKFIVSGME